MVLGCQTCYTRGMDTQLLLASALLLGLPFAVRFIFTPLVYRRLRRRQLPDELEYMLDGWGSEQDEEAVRDILSFVRRRFHPLLPFAPDPLEDAKALMLLVEQRYRGGEELSFRFPLNRLLYCGFFLFEDLLDSYGRRPWFRLLSRLPLSWYRRYTLLQRLRKKLSQLPPLRFLSSLRLIGPVLRILLIGVIGLPLLFVMLLRSLLLSGVLEGYVRFLYGDLLLRFSYYLIYLYSGDNRIIAQRRSSLSRSRIMKRGKGAEELLARRIREGHRREECRAAWERYEQLLSRWDLEPDLLFSGGDGAGERFVRRGEQLFRTLFRSGGRAVMQLFELRQDRVEDLRRLQELFSELSRLFYPDAKDPRLCLRPGDLIRVGYTAVLLAMRRIYQFPGLGELAGSVRCDVAITVKALGEEESLRDLARGLFGGWRLWRKSRRLSRLGRLVSGAGGVWSLAGSLVLPTLGQGLGGAFRSYLYHRSGRLCIDLFSGSGEALPDPIIALEGKRGEA